ncbi:NHL repeat-containing protein [Spirosoma gilvum]
MNPSLLTHFTVKPFVGAYLSALLVLATFRLPAQTISTIAGSTLKGDNGPAISANLNTPLGVAIDGSGNLFIADQANSCIRKVATNGIITTVAGNGSYGYGGDGGPATAASLKQPGAVAVDGSGNLFIADLGDSRIRKVDISGTITTVAGSSSIGFGGDGFPATSAKLNSPMGIAVDGSGNLFIADLGNNRIRKVATDGIISTVAGTGTSGFSGDGGPATAASFTEPSGVAVDGGGNLFIVDQGNHRIRKITPDTFINTVAGNGTPGFSGDNSLATSATLWNPAAVWVDANGNLFIADQGNQRIRRVRTDGVIITVAGNGTLGFSGDTGPATSASFNQPAGVVVDGGGNLFIADAINQRVRKVATNGIINTVAGNGTTDFGGDNGPATSAALNQPAGLALDGNGNLFVADQLNNRIRKIASDGTITTVAGNGEASFSGDEGPATSAALNSPSGVAVDGPGNLFIVDQGNHRIRKVSTDGTIRTIAGNGTADFGGDGGPAVSASLYLPSGVAVDGAGSVFIADVVNQRIRKVSIDGTISTIAGNGTEGFSGDGGPAVSASLNLPFGVALDGSGNVYIADLGNRRIRKVSTDGNISTIAGNGNFVFSGDGGAATAASFTGPSGLFIDGQGNVFIADQANNRIRKVGVNGLISSVAGNGSEGFSGDGGPASSAALSHPTGIVRDGSGNLLIADQYNNRIRKVALPLATADLTPTLTLPQSNFGASGAELTRNFVLNLFEVGGLRTSGSVVITLTAPVGYSLSFTNSLTSIQVTGGSANPVSVDNTKWSLTTNIASQQLSLTINAGQFVEGDGVAVLGFTITRTTANSGSVSNITVNVTNDASNTYDSNSANNIYARIISGL